MVSNSMPCQTCSEDRISRLPDGILCHILSFLDITETVKTSGLSHRWKDVWVSFPTLKFNVQNPESDKGRSAGFVDQVLSHSGSSSIQRFELVCYGVDDYFSRIRDWVCTALRRNVVELLLYLFPNPGKLYEFPQSLFKCKTLSVLKLRLQFDLIAIPSNSDCFPHLKILHVTVCCPNADSMKKLFSCCPALEDLVIDGFISKIAREERLVLSFTVSAPKLRRLRICLRRGSNNYVSININAPHLEKLDLFDNFLVDYALKNEKSLSTAKIAVQIHKRGQNDHLDNDYAARMHRLFAGIINVKSLSLSAPILRDSDPKFQRLLPTFYNLNHLELLLKTCCSWKSLIKLLEISPNLENLVFENNVECYTADDKNKLHEWCPPSIVPICLLSSLKSISVRGYKWRPDEMEVAKYMLEHGVVLKKVIVYTRSIPMEKQMELEQEFSKFPRASKTCQIELVELKAKG
ncbi:F-box/LRR-repeat protein At4g14103-like [Pyrus communis]|uniref:F-box/LRR-repeat protein At4g14103-like n=1 Tax=Pyrus communis TaxID=23211 RepID=UPI0035C24FBF